MQRFELPDTDSLEERQQKETDKSHERKNSNRSLSLNSVNSSRASSIINSIRNAVNRLPLPLDSANITGTSKFVEQIANPWKIDLIFVYVNFNIY